MQELTCSVINPMGTEKATYTPAEFAKFFGKERTWGYRQLYAGKVKAITKLGQTLIPQSEVDKLLASAERYRGAPSHTERTVKRRAKKKAGVTKGAKEWSAALKRKRKPGSPPPKNAHSEGARKPSWPKPRHPDAPASSKQSVYQRLTRYKSSRKDGEDHGE